MGISAGKAFLRALVWVAISLVFLDVGWERIVDLRAAGRYVNPLRYANVAVWVVSTVFWGWSACVSWKHWRAQD